MVVKKNESRGAMSSVRLSERLDALRKGERPATQSRFIAPGPLPWLVPLQNSHGTTYYCDQVYIDHHGQIDLKNFPNFPVESLEFLSRESLPTPEGFDIREALFLDIETTGTAGGTGTFAFLVGLGFVDTGFFQVRQYFLHDLAEEAAFLQAIQEFSAKFRFLLTYNGKCFDSQILRTRYLMHRRDDPLSDKRHIDMLFIARRLWKRKHGPCDLMNLERQVLNFHRMDDIPGYLIPSAYTDYLRFANASLIEKVLQHNRWDIVSLAVLAARACRLSSGADVPDAGDHLAMGLLREKNGDFESAIDHMKSALGKGCENRRDVLLALSRNLRRTKDHAEIKRLVDESMNDPLDDELCRRICILCEHDLKDYPRALELVNQRLEKLQKYAGVSRKYSELLQEWTRRQKRLLRKTQAEVEDQVGAL